MQGKCKKNVKLLGFGVFFRLWYQIEGVQKKSTTIAEHTIYPRGQSKTLLRQTTTLHETIRKVSYGNEVVTEW